MEKMNQEQLKSSPRSIVIPTYNKCEFLKNTVERLIELFEERILSTGSEIIIINNNSSDNTAAIGRQLVQDRDYLKFFLEPEQGLSNARNRGIKESANEIIVFIDDDFDFGLEWFDAIISGYQYDNVVASGGPVCPHREIPTWIPPRFYYLLSISNNVNENDFRKILMGGNCSILKSFLTEIGGFDNKLGRKGGSLASGEEIDVFAKVDARNKRCYHDAKALVYHFIDDKFNKDYLIRFSYENGKSVARIEKEKARIRFYLYSILSIFRLLYPKKNISLILLKSHARGYLGLSKLS